MAGPNLMGDNWSKTLNTGIGTSGLPSIASSSAAGGAIGSEVSPGLGSIIGAGIGAGVSLIGLLLSNSQEKAKDIATLKTDLAKTTLAGNVNALQNRAAQRNNAFGMLMSTKPQGVQF